MKPQNGFALVEIMIVIAIVGFIGFLGIQSVDNKVTQIASSDVINMLYTAKSRANSQVKPNECNEQLSGYEVTIDINDGLYTLSVICGETYPLEIKSLPENVTFDQGSASRVFFPIITGVPLSSKSIILTGYGKTNTINISTTGSISNL